MRLTRCLLGANRLIFEGGGGGGGLFGEQEFFHVPHRARIFFWYKTLAGIFFLNCKHFHPFGIRYRISLSFTSCCSIYFKRELGFQGIYFQKSPNPPPPFPPQRSNGWPLILSIWKCARKFPRFAATHVVSVGFQIRQSEWKFERNFSNCFVVCKFNRFWLLWEMFRRLVPKRGLLFRMEGQDLGSRRMYSQGWRIHSLILVWNCQLKVTRSGCC